MPSAFYHSFKYELYDSGLMETIIAGIRWEVIMNRIRYEVGSNHEQDQVFGGK